MHELIFKFPQKQINSVRILIHSAILLHTKNQTDQIHTHSQRLEFEIN
jgi:hypothetical protein